MREILFKAKRIDNGEWVEGLLTVMWGRYHIINPNDENTAYPIVSDTICQYIGLLDKNGQKIWENDVVRHYNNPSEPKHFVIGVIYWNSDNLRHERTSQYEHAKFSVLYDCVYEVIGNIFDNPELLSE